MTGQSSMRLPILIADDDPFICELLVRTLQGDMFEVRTVHDGTEALRVLESEDAPRLALLDWMMPGLDGVEVCRRLRTGVSGAYTHVFVMSGNQSTQDVLRSFDAGVDGFIAKPFDPKVVRARLQAAGRRMQNESAGGVRGISSLLRQASQGQTGEVVVRGRDRVGHIVFHQGKVAWIHLSGSASLLPLLTGFGISEKEARLVLEECRKARLPFMDTLVSWGLISREALRDRLRLELVTRLETLLNMPEGTGFFVPGASPLQSGLLYELSEIEPVGLGGHSSLPPPGVGPSPVPPIPPAARAPVAPSIHEFVVELSGLEGVEGVSVFEPPSGHSVLNQGAPSDEVIVRTMARLFLRPTDETPEESFLATTTKYHLMRRLTETLLLYVRLDRKKNTNLGLVRLMMSQRQQG